MNRDDRFDPKAAQKQSAFSELSSYRRRADAAEAKLEDIQGRIDAKEAGVTLKQYEEVRATLRDLLVACENQYLSTKGDTKKIPKEINTAMRAAQKLVRPNANGEKLLPEAVLEKLAKLNDEVPNTVKTPVRLEFTATSVRATPA
jgi:hypothetical protein